MSVLNPSLSNLTFASLDLVDKETVENQIRGGVGRREDEIGEVDIVEDQIREKHDEVGEGRMGKGPVRGGSLTVSGQRRRIHD